jgi:hypothetical protein
VDAPTDGILNAMTVLDEPFGGQIDDEEHQFTGD